MTARQVVVRAGVTLVLASATLLGGLRLWEGGADGRVVPDKLAGDLPTGCYGVTKHSSDAPVIVGDVWSTERCELVLVKNATTYGFGVLDCVSAPLTQNQLDAMTHFAYNVGITGACGSVAFGLIDAGRYAEGCRALAYTPKGNPNWSVADGKFVRGLHNRRIWEMKLCLKP